MSKRLDNPKEYTGRWADIPPWMTNTELAAPCICGMPLNSKEPFCITEAPSGLKRWWHGDCWELFMNAHNMKDADE